MLVPITFLLSFRTSICFLTGFLSFCWKLSEKLNAAKSKTKQIPKKKADIVVGLEVNLLDIITTVSQRNLYESHDSANL